MLGVATGLWSHAPTLLGGTALDAEGPHVCSDIAAMHSAPGLLFGKGVVWPSLCHWSPTLLLLADMYQLGRGGCEKEVTPFWPPPLPCKSGRTRCTAPQ